MSNPSVPQIDAGRVIQRLGQRIADLEIQCAQQDALIQQLIAEQTNGPAPQPASASPDVS